MNRYFSSTGNSITFLMVPILLFIDWREKRAF